MGADLFIESQNSAPSAVGGLASCVIQTRAWLLDAKKIRNLTMEEVKILELIEDTNDTLPYLHKLPPVKSN